jgi:uncharacterized protein YaiL (DUF2058 family)
MEYTKPQLRERIKSQVMSSDKGGKPGQWSARKAQLVAQKYEAAGGGYSGEKSSSQKSLSKWTKEEWTTKSGKPSTQGPKATGERYLPKKAIQAMPESTYAASTKAKREAISKGKQFSSQPENAKKIAKRFR